jgi:hypothetical protein
MRPFLNLQSAICNRKSQIALGPGGQRHHPRLDLRLIFLPPAAATNPFQQHQQTFRMVETCFQAIGKAHQRAAAAAIARNIQLDGIGYCSQFQDSVTFLCARRGLGYRMGWPLTACSLFRNLIVAQRAHKSIFR